MSAKYVPISWSVSGRPNHVRYQNRKAIRTTRTGTRVIQRFRNEGRAVLCDAVGVEAGSCRGKAGAPGGFSDGFNSAPPLTPDNTKIQGMAKKVPTISAVGLNRKAIIPNAREG